MTVALMALGVGTAWCVLPLPLAIAVGRVLRAADDDAVFAEIVRGYHAT